MKFYLAGKWSDKEKITSLMKDLTDLGHTCAHNWTKNEAKTRDDSTLGGFALLDINGVKDADYYIAFINDPDYLYRGTFTEMGAALGLGKHVYIVEELPPRPDDGRHPCQRSCFYFHPQVHHLQGWDNFLKEFKKETIHHLRNMLSGFIFRLGLTPNTVIKLYRCGTLTLNNPDQLVNLDKIPSQFKFTIQQPIIAGQTMYLDPTFDDGEQDNQIALIAENKTLEEAQLLFERDLQEREITYDSSVDGPMSQYEPITYLLVNKDLRMSPGKVLAQGGHVIQKMMSDLEKGNTRAFLDWKKSMMKKVSCKITEKELLDVLKDATCKPYSYCIHDAGLTQVAPGSLTVAAVGPLLRKDFPEKFKEFKLY